MEKDKFLKNERQKQNYEAMEPSRKRMLLEKKKGQQELLRINLNYKRREQNVIQNDGFRKFKNIDLLLKQAEIRNFNVNNNCAVTIHSLSYSVMKSFPPNGNYFNVFHHFLGHVIFRFGSSVTKF